MTLNFSIDVILGKTSLDKKSSSNARTQAGQVKATRNNYTVQWRTCKQEPTERRFDKSRSEHTEPQYPYNTFHLQHNRRFDICATKPYQPILQNQAYHNLQGPLRLGDNSSSTSCGAFPLDGSSSDDSDTDVRNRLNDSSEISTGEKSDRLNSSLPTSDTSPQSSKSSSARIGRRLFTGFQILELDKAFSIKPYLTRSERALLAQKVNLTECQIKTWFQNRRTKEKRRGHETDDDDVATSDVITSKPYFPKCTRIPGHGVQVRPTFGPPDKHLQAAIFDYLRRRSHEEISVK
uniref:Homeobox protein MSH-B n=1 Tax=Ciona intestinalis TaxID=7719 RepID=F6XKF8_CIOIN|nr:homeobox protein MSH-B [Ciona intestinalis]|eukprot:XP_002121214.1 homeobox protein MSH-B [Ciona intestinalis]